MIAGQQIPHELAQNDPNARGKVDWLAWPLTYLPRAARDLHEFIRSLPRLPRPAGPVAATPPRHSYPNCPGGLVLRLQHNRNLDWMGSAQYLYGLGGGPMLSPSTMGMIGHGQRALTPDLLAGFGAVLDIGSVDLSILTGVDMPAADERMRSGAGEVAELIWSAPVDRGTTAPGPGSRTRHSP